MTIELSKLGERFEDWRGHIQNLLEQPCGGVSVIFTKAGATRSSHFHRHDHHYLWVMSGSMRYVEMPVDLLDAEPGRRRTSQRRILAGEMVFTGPMLAHTTYFDEDTWLVSMSKNARSHVEHEADLVRCEPLRWVDE